MIWVAGKKVKRSMMFCLCGQHDSFTYTCHWTFLNTMTPCIHNFCIACHLLLLRKKCSKKTVFFVNKTSPPTKKKKHSKNFPLPTKIVGIPNICLDLWRLSSSRWFDFAPYSPPFVFHPTGTSASPEMRHGKKQKNGWGDIVHESYLWFNYIIGILMSCFMK